MLMSVLYYLVIGIIVFGIESLVTVITYIQLLDIELQKIQFDKGYWITTITYIIAWPITMMWWLLSYIIVVKNAIAFQKIREQEKEEAWNRLVS